MRRRTPIRAAIRLAAAFTPVVLALAIVLVLFGRRPPLSVGGAALPTPTPPSLAGATARAVAWVTERATPNPGALVMDQTSAYLPTPVPSQTPTAAAAPTVGATPTVAVAPTPTISPPTPKAMPVATANARPTAPDRGTPSLPAGMHVTLLSNGLQRADLPQFGLSVVYPPGTFAATHLAEFISNWREASAYVHQRLGVAAPAPMTVELRADGAADPLGLGVRGYSVPAEGRMYQLYDGSGDAGDREYITAHELGHMIIYHRDGSGANLMLSEGIAMYASDEFLRRDHVTTLDEFAEAAYLAHRLKPLTSLSAPNAGFHGRLVDRLDYDLSGAFVSYLINTYGMQKFDLVYSNANYPAIYGKTLPEINQEWVAFLAAQYQQHPLSFDAGAYFTYLDRVSSAYTRLYNAAAQDDDHLYLPAYQDVDAARLAVDRHDFSTADRSLAAFARAL